MTDDLNDSRPIEWLRGLFEDASAESMFRWVIVAWLVLVFSMVVLDRFGAGLLGRSRPLLQSPPERARTWRWGRRTPPSTYSLLPTGTLAEAAPRAVPELAESIPLSTRPVAALPAAVLAPVDNTTYWIDAANPAAPRFGYENVDRLSDGAAPERYNPITGRVESLDRDGETGALVWPGDATDPVILGAPDVAETTELTLPSEDLPEEPVAEPEPEAEMRDADESPDVDADSDDDDADADESTDEADPDADDDDEAGPDDAEAAADDAADTADTADTDEDEDDDEDDDADADAAHTDDGELVEIEAGAE